MEKKKQSIRRNRSLLFLFLAAGTIFIIWKWGGQLLSPDVYDENSRDFIKWLITTIISLPAFIIALVNFILPSPPSGSVVDNTDRILRQTSPEQLIKEYVPAYDQKITWIDRGALTADQLHIDHKILLVGRMNSGKSREIAEFIRKRMEDGTFVSSCVYDITGGISALDPKLITETVRNKLDPGQRVVFYVNDLPRQASEKQLEVLDAYLKELKGCSPGYFLATARSDHLAANAPLKSWLVKNQVKSVELPLLAESQTGQLVEELASLHGFQWETEAKQTLCGHMDGTPYHPILSFINLKTKLANSDSKVITEELAEDESKGSAQTIWLDIQTQIKKADSLAEEFFEALAVFYTANITAHPAIFKAYARSLVFAHHKWPLLWGFKQRWEKVLEMLKKYAIDFQEERVKFPDAAAEAAIKVLCEKGKLCPGDPNQTVEKSANEALTRLKNFALAHRWWLRNAWLRRFNAQAGAQQDLLVDLAGNYYFKGQIDKALELMKQATRVAQPSARIWRNYGVLLEEKGDLVGAEQAYRAAVAADEKLAPAWYNLGELLKDKGDLMGAEQAFHAAVAADEKYAPAWSNLGLLLDDRGDLMGAEMAYRAAVAADVKYAPAWNNLGLLLRMTKRFEDALPVLQRLISLQPNEASDHAQLGSVYQNLGRAHEAQTEFAAARSLMSSETPYNQACIAALIGETGLALDLLQQAITSGEVERKWVRQDPKWEDYHTNERWLALTAE